MAATEVLVDDELIIKIGIVPTKPLWEQGLTALELELLQSVDQDGHLCCLHLLGGENASRLATVNTSNNESHLGA